MSGNRPPRDIDAVGQLGPVVSEPCELGLARVTVQSPSKDPSPLVGEGRGEGSNAGGD
jgi:hypothetical protein